MQALQGKHPDEHTLEAYLLRSLPPRETKRIEEHVLVCSECIDTAKELEEYIRSMRATLENRKVLTGKIGPLKNFP